MLITVNVIQVRDHAQQKQTWSNRVCWTVRDGIEWNVYKNIGANKEEDGEEGEEDDGGEDEDEREENEEEGKSTK